jgi:hypothetical protein
METMERTEGPTPSGGAYSEAHFFDDDMNPVSKESATQIIIRECSKDGTLINTTHGILQGQEE